MLLVDWATLVAEEEKVEDAFNYFSSILENWLRLMIGRVNWTLRPWGSIAETCPLSVAYSRRRKFGRSLRSCPWIRHLDLMGSQVLFISLPG
jgi:hypothetical protein